MKHFFLSLTIFIIILSGSFAAHIYTKNIVDDIDTLITPVTKSQQVSETDIRNTEKIKDIFEKNKDMLRFFVNKEHIQKVEISILLLDNAVQSGDRDKMRECGLEIASMLDHIESYLTAFN